MSDRSAVPNLFPDPYRDWDGAYLLGSLSPAERTEFEQHLTSCPQCSAAVAELAGIPGILARITEQDAAAPVVDLPAPNMLPLLGARIRRRRVRNAALVAALAAGSAAAAVGITYAVVPQPSGPAVVQAAGMTLPFEPVNGAPLAVTGTARQLGWGTEITWRCSYSAATPYAGTGRTVPADPKPYELIVTDIRGRQTVAASWYAGPGTTVSPTATVATPLAQIRSIDVRWTTTGKTAVHAGLRP